MVVASIGTTDPWNAAGLGLDLRALAELGATGVTVTAAVSAQDRTGVHAVYAVASALVTAQFAALADAGIAAVRIGALVDAPTVVAVADALADATVPIVYDPVLAASGGGTFADPATQTAIVARLLPLVTVVMPNLREAGLLLGVPEPRTVDGMVVAGRALRAAGAAAVLVTGGHLAGDDASGASLVTDVLVDALGTTTFADARLPFELRGTGCLLAIGVAVALARGVSLREAVTDARSFVRAKILGGRLRGGMRVAY